MIVMSRTTIKNAQSGAAGNQTIWKIAFTETKNSAGKRADVLPDNRPTPVATRTPPRTRWTQPQSVTSPTIAPWPPTMTMSSLRIAASPQSAFSAPTMKSITPANAAQPEPAPERDSPVVIDTPSLDLVDEPQM